MATVVVAKRIDAAIDAVWASWDDFGNIATFHPSLAKSYLLTDQGKPTRVGTRRQCDMDDHKNWVREEVIEYQANRRMRIDVYDSSMPIKMMQATVEVEEISANRSRVRLTVEFEPSMGMLGKLMVPLMKRQFTATLQAVLDANAAYVQRGEVVAAAA